MIYDYNKWLIILTVITLNSFTWSWKSLEKYMSVKVKKKSAKKKRLFIPNFYGMFESMPNLLFIASPGAKKVVWQNICYLRTFEHWEHLPLTERIYNLQFFYLLQLRIRHTIDLSLKGHTRHPAINLQHVYYIFWKIRIWTHDLLFVSRFR